MAIRITFVWNELNEKVLQYRKPPQIHADHMPEPKVTELFENEIWDSARHGSQNTRSNELQRAKQDKVNKMVLIIISLKKQCLNVWYKKKSL